MFTLNESNVEAVQAIMEDEKSPKIVDNYRKAVTEKLIDNQMTALKESTQHANHTGGMDGWDPILINMVRRSTPNLLAFDLAGVQPMGGPTGLIFALRPRYTNNTGPSAFYNEANTAHSGTGAMAGDTSGFAQDAFGVGDPAASTATGTGMATSDAEILGAVGGGTWGEMAITIEKTEVGVKTRALKAEFTDELAQDAKVLHQINIEQELATVLSTEIGAETDREMLRTINISAKPASNISYDVSTDADGRWLVEKWKSFIFNLELMANAIAVDTRRGKGNVIVGSANVISAIAMTGLLEYNPQLSVNLSSDVTGNTFAGVLNGKFRVYIDPYATVDYITVGYKGASSWDAGVYYCPYVPLQMSRAIGEDTFQPKIGFKTRYGIVANPFAATDDSGAKAGKGLAQGENPYYRKQRVTSIQG